MEELIGRRRRAWLKGIIHILLLYLWMILRKLQVSRHVRLAWLLRSAFLLVARTLQALVHRRAASVCSSRETTKA